MTPFEIDLNKIFIGGISAGGLMTVMAAWYSNTMIYQSFPSPSGMPTIQDALGPIDADYYYGEPNIAYKNYVRGVLSMWGGIPIPGGYEANQQDFFTQSGFPATIKPVIAFHGKQDKTFPFDMNDPAQNVQFSPTSSNPNYNSETRCILNSSYTVDGIVGSNVPPDLISASSDNIYTIGKALSATTPFELYVDCEMGHGLDNDQAPGFESDFGTPYTTEDEVTVYIAQRAAIFFQAVMNNLSAAQIGPPSRFTECINYRIKCQKLSNPGCNDTDQCSNP